MKRAILICGVLGVAASLTGCATQVVEKGNDTSIASVAGHTPAGPPSVFKGDRSMAEESAAVVATPAPAPTGFERTLKRMEKNPLTLYRAEQKAYTYYIGDLLEAQYKPEKGLTLRKGTGISADLVCKYNLDGGLNAASASPEKVADAQRACADLMFTFDQQLAE